MDEKHSHNCGCGHDKHDKKDAEIKKNDAQKSDGDTMDFMHNPPTDRETLSDPEALDDLVGMRHLE